MIQAEKQIFLLIFTIRYDRESPTPQNRYFVSDMYIYTNNMDLKMSTFVLISSTWFYALMVAVDDGGKCDEDN